MYIFIPNKSENDKTEYDKNNGKIVSLSRAINSMYVTHINVRIIGFLLTNTFGTALKIAIIFSRGLILRELEKLKSPLKNDEYQISCDKKSLAVHVSAYYILVNRK